MSKNIRSFITIELPAEVRSVLDNVQQGLKALGLKAKWVRPASIHLTLKFLGNIDPAAIDDIGRAMVEAAGGCDTFTLTVGGIGFFPGIKRARVVWAGLGGILAFVISRLRKSREGTYRTYSKRIRAGFFGWLLLSIIISSLTEEGDIFDRLSQGPLFKAWTVLLFVTVSSSPSYMGIMAVMTR